MWRLLQASARRSTSYIRWNDKAHVNIDTLTLPAGLIWIAAAAILIVVVLVLSALPRRRDEHDRLLASLSRLEAQINAQYPHVESVGERLEQRLRGTENLLRVTDHNLRGTQADTRETLVERLGELREHLQESLHRQGAVLDQRQVRALGQIQESVQQSLGRMRGEMAESLALQARELGSRFDALAATTDQKLTDIRGQVDQRLAEGFEKTHQTFTDVIKRLALIDEAQKRISELSGNVMSLQQVLSDKRSRGAFGEVQLQALVRNVMPESSFQMQATLSNGTRADCILDLPPPTGKVVIDAKFPLENYRKLIDTTPGSAEAKSAERQFKTDIRKHISDISSKYLIPGETAEGALMFIPAEAVFAEIHAHHSDLVEAAHRARVWLASPTTLMAVLTTSRAVLKDEATRQQVHVLRDHLAHLGDDFQRFQQRMDKLARHLDQATQDVQDIHSSARKITQRFDKIERVELNDETPPQ